MPRTSKNKFEIINDEIYISKEGWPLIGLTTYREDYYEELTSKTWTLTKANSETDIDNYIMASDSIKIGEFDDLTLLDFVIDQGETMTGEDTPSGQKEGAAEAIENNIRRKMVEKVTVNPKYYEKMSAILDKLIQDRQKGVLSYKELLDEYIKLAKNVDHPEENEDYPESVRHSKAMQALCDNVGGDEALAIELHKAVMDSKMSGFRGDSIKERRIKRVLFAILNDDTEVERFRECFCMPRLMKRYIRIMCIR